MYKNKTVSVVVPAHNEEKLITRTLSTIPDFVDSIIVVNDCSSDNTEQRIKDCMKENKKIILISHERNKGVGKTISDGYSKSLELNMDIIAVMNADAQMDPAELPDILDKIVSGEADYAKGNRLLFKATANVMPGYRYYGNFCLSVLAKFTSGYWHVIDPVSGYTAISQYALRAINPDKIFQGYGYLIDILARLNIFNFKVADIPVKAIYGEEVSGIKLHTYIPRVSKMLVRMFFFRMFHKYAIRDFHPLVFFVILGLLFIGASLIPLICLIGSLFHTNIHAFYALTQFFILFGFGSQFFLLGIWMDKEHNKFLDATDKNIIIT